MSTDLTRDAIAEGVVNARKALDGIEDLRERATKADEIIAGLRKDLRDVTLQRQAEHVRQYDPAGSDVDVLRCYTVDPDELARDPISKNYQIRDLGNRNDGTRDTHPEYVGRKGEGDNVVVRMTGREEFGEYRPGLIDDPHPKTEWQRKLQYLVDLRSIAKMAISNGRTPKLDAAIAYHLRRAPGVLAKVFSGNAGEGAEWQLPSMTMPETYRKAELPREVAALFDVVELTTGDSTKNPFMTRGVQPFIMEQPGSGSWDPAQVQGSVPTTSEVSTTPKTMGIVLPANRDATEDAVIAWGPRASELVAEGIRDGREDYLINGDTGTHGDTGIAAWNPRSRWHAGLLGSSLDHRYMAIGLRHIAIDASAAADYGSSQTAVGMGTALAELDGPHAFDDVVYIMSPEFLLVKLLTDSNLLTVDKLGPNATLLTGQVASLYGRPVILSEFIDVQYNASGVYDDSTKTKTGVLLVNRSRFFRGVRRSIRVEQETVARTNTTYTVASVRESFGRVDTSAVKSCAWLYNLSPS